jgi:tellurite methyltransferase
MPEADRTKWNAKYSQVAFAASEPSPLLVELDDLLPRSGRVLDIAGGAGRHAIWLAQRGLDVTIADISEVGLQCARARADGANVSIRTLLVDLEAEPFPAGPWDLIVSVCYLWRPLFRTIPAALEPGGMLVVVQPTRSNLSRHEKPPAAYLLDDGELPKLVEGLEIIRYDEGWLDGQHHEARLVACRNCRESG